MELPDDRQQAYQLFHNCNLTLQSATKRDREIREEEQRSNSINITTAQHTNEARTKRIRKLEAVRRTWHTLRYLKTKGTTAQRLDRLDIPASWPTPNTPIPDISSLEDPKKCNNWITVSDPADIEFYTQLRNRAHFGQAQGTPFTI
jgi:hypothetical protein